MIEHLDVDEAERALQGLGQDLVRLARLCDAARVIVRKYHAAGVVPEDTLDHLARVDARLRQRPGEEFLDRDNAVLRVEHHHAVKSQIWIAVSVYVLVAIVRKRLNLSASLYEMLQILSLTMFERTSLHQLLTLAPAATMIAASANQLSLFE
jgi:hypothetical protein